MWKWPSIADYCSIFYENYYTLVSPRSHLEEDTQKMKSVAWLIISLAGFLRTYVCAIKAWKSKTRFTDFPELRVHRKAKLQQKIIRDEKYGFG